MQQLDSRSDGASLDTVGENIRGMRKLFPDAFTEGRVDFDVLRGLLGDYVDDEQERYSFSWHGKSAARRIAQTPSTGTLRPCPGESMDWDTTQNLFIEGDNLEVLKLLQKSYYGRVKLIYIDPPYNTGGEFIYPDKFEDNLSTYLKYSGQIDDRGFRLAANAETSGRYHTNWLNMMYPRLKLARNLLCEDGVVFISIDDHEVANLRRLCDEIFGDENFVATVIWQKVYAPKNSARHFSEDHDYILVYAKRGDLWTPRLLDRTADQDALYKNPDGDPRGPWMSDNLTARNAYKDGRYEVTGPTGGCFAPPKGRYWVVSEEKFRKLDGDDRVWWGADRGNMPRLKRFLSEVSSGRVPQTLWTYKEVGHTQEAKKELIEYVQFEHTENVLNSVKPSRLIRRILSLATDKDGSDIVLDFFAGSGSTAQAVLQQNLDDGGNRRFLLVQLPEPLPIPETCVRTIADLAKSRIRNVIKAEASGSSQTPGFKVLKLAASCLRSWDSDGDNLEKTLFEAVENMKPDRTGDDLLHELMLKYGLDLSVSVDIRNVEGRRAFVVAHGALIAVLEGPITERVADGIVRIRTELKPEVMRVLFRDADFANDVQKTNVSQILKNAGIEDVRSV